MSRKTTVLGFSVPLEVAEEYERLARRQGTTKSELFLRMVSAYKARMEEKEFFHLQRRMSGHAGRRGDFTERDIEKLVFDDR